MEHWQYFDQPSMYFLFIIKPFPQRGLLTTFLWHKRYYGKGVLSYQGKRANLWNLWTFQAFSLSTWPNGVFRSMNTYQIDYKLEENDSDLEWNYTTQRIIANILGHGLLLLMTSNKMFWYIRICTNTGRSSKSK